jgi:hypothetical protein
VIPEPDRRAVGRTRSQKLGFWMLTNSATWAVIVITHFMLLAAISIGVAILAQSSNDQVNRLESQVEASNKVADDAKLVADFIKNCIFFPELKQCHVENLEIRKTDSSTNPPANATSTTTTTR